MQLQHVSTQVVVRRTSDAAHRCRAGLAELLSCLAEMDARRAHRELGFSSLWDYCLRALHLSESETSRRIRVARLIRRVPAALQALRSGQVHLTGLSMLSRVLTADNAADVLRRAAGQSKRALEILVMELSPSSQPRMDKPEPTVIRPVGLRPAPAPKPANTVSSSTTTDPSERPSASLEPVHRVTVTLTETVVRKLEKARDLLCFRVENGDDNAIFERALDLLLAKTEKDRFGAPAPRQGKRRTQGPTRYIQAAERRQVYNRDDEGCEFVGHGGMRCGSRRIQIHHKHAYGKGGSNEAQNLAKFCWTHNQLMAEIDFGPR